MSKSKSGSWKIAEAKQNLSSVVSAAERDRQLIYRRDELVAAVIGVEELEKLESLDRRQEQRSLTEAFEELREIVREERYRWHIPRRRDRSARFPPE